MAGVLFIVTIPTQEEEHEIELKEKQSKLGHSSKKESERNDYGSFKITSPEGFLLEKEYSDFNQCVGLLNLPFDSSMESIMIELFKKLQIDNAVWQSSKNDKYYQITFFVESNTRHELVLTTLNEWGIGQRNESCMSMIPCAIYNQSTKTTTNEFGPKTEPMSERKQTAWERFISSVHARWNVAQIVQRVKDDATITFDYVTLIIVAGMLAAFGLIENDSTTVISSMLISPLMSPIIATIFGIVIRDYALVRFGLLSEFFGISIATLIGFVFCFISCAINSEYAYGSKAALTNEMIHRCEFRSLMIGLLTALPTGAAAAIAVLEGNSGSLVGVAISVSLLPPAVNAGVLWALAVLYKLNEKDDTLYSKVVMTNHYSDHQSVELAVYGVISMLLTIVNALCILLVGVLTLKIKEVAPRTPRNQHQLWGHDIKIARDFNVASNEDRMSRQMTDEISELRSSDDPVRSMFRQSYQHTWSPMSTPFQMHDNMDDLEGICLNMEYPTSSQLIFDAKNRSERCDYTKRRASMPYSIKSKYPSVLSNLQVINRFRLEKIPEGSTQSSSNENGHGNENQETSSSSCCTSSTDAGGSHKDNESPSDVKNTV